MSDVNSAGAVPPNGSSTSTPPYAQTPYAPFALADLRIMTLIAYGLYLAMFVTGPITPVIGVVLAYVKRDDAHGTVYQSHLEQLIRLFWTSLGVCLAAFLLALTIVGIPLAIAGMGVLVIYYLVRTVVGMVKAAEARPYRDVLARPMPVRPA